MAQTIEVVIDGKPHTVTELKARKNRQWREKLLGEFQGIVGLINEAQGGDLEFERPEDLMAFLRKAGDAALPAIDKLFDLAVAYDPAFEEAYDSEIAAAFPELLGLAYPVGPLVEAGRKMLGNLGGLAQGATTPTSPSANGDAGTTS